MQRVGLTRNQNTFNDVGLTLYRCPGVNNNVILVFHHKFGSTDLLISGDIRLAHMDLCSVILHHYGLYFAILIYNKDNVACNHVAIR